MALHSPAHNTRHARSTLAGAMIFGLMAFLVPASANAAVTTIGSPLSVQATLNTAENLNYQGSRPQA